MADKHDVLSPFQEFKNEAVGADLDFLAVPDAPFRFQFAGVERSSNGALDIDVTVERVEESISFLHHKVTGTTDPSVFIPGPVGETKIPFGYGVRVVTTGIAGGETVKTRIVIEKLVDY